MDIAVTLIIVVVGVYCLFHVVIFLLSLIGIDTRWLFGSPDVEKMVDRGDIKGLAAAVHYNKDESVAEAAAEALREIGDPAVKPLYDSIRNDNWDVAQVAADTLGRIGDPRAIDPLLEILMNADITVDTDLNTLRAVAGALQRIGWQPGDDEAAAWYWVAMQDPQGALCP